MLAAREGGWGLAVSHRSVRTHLVGLLSPFWMPLVLLALAFAIGQAAFAIAALGATVIFVPGVLTIANYSRWPRLVRFLACLAYVVLAEIAYLGMLYAGAQLIYAT